MVTVDRVSEAVIIGPAPPAQRHTVCSMVHMEDHRRFREEVHLAPKQVPVRYSDTIYRYLKTDRSRYVSRTFYQRRMAAKGFAQTNFTFPRSLSETFVSYLDHDKVNTNKRFKTAVEISGVVKAAVDVNYLSTLVVGEQTDRQTDAHPDLLSDSDTEMQDSGPGASQVYIPKRGATQIHTCIRKPDTSLHTLN